MVFLAAPMSLSDQLPVGNLHTGKLPVWVPHDGSTPRANYAEPSACDGGGAGAVGGSARSAFMAPRMLRPWV